MRSCCFCHVSVPVIETKCATQKQNSSLERGLRIVIPLRVAGKRNLYFLIISNSATRSCDRNLSLWHSGE